MAISMNKISVHPLFCEALSGEFYSPVDPDKRPRTLARLLCSTLVKGESLVPQATVVHYRPSWAPGLEAYAVRDAWNLDDIVHKAAAVHLAIEQETLTFRQCEQGVAPFGIDIVQDDKYTETFPIEEDADLLTARDIVTTKVQGFFNKLNT